MSPVLPLRGKRSENGDYDYIVGKKAKTCPACGTTFSPFLSFCPKCGTEVEK